MISCFKKNVTVFGNNFAQKIKIVLQWANIWFMIHMPTSTYIDFLVSRSKACGERTLSQLLRQQVHEYDVYPFFVLLFWTSNTQICCVCLCTLFIRDSFLFFFPLFVSTNTNVAMRLSLYFVYYFLSYIFPVFTVLCFNEWKETQNICECVTTTKIPMFFIMTKIS